MKQHRYVLDDLTPNDCVLLHHLVAQALKGELPYFPVWGLKKIERKLNKLNECWMHDQRKPYEVA